MEAWMTDLTGRFGDRVTFDRIERTLYSHDVASLPAMIDRLVRRVPEAVVQPLTEEDVAFLARFARQHNLPLVPRGRATSGYGGAVPVKGGVVVDFGRMNAVLDIDEEKHTVTVQPGVIWEALEKAVRTHGLALRVCPTSTPGATVAGWVAEGGVGIGSFAYGSIAENVFSVRIVTPGGQVRELSGTDLDLVTGMEGTTGFITSVTVRLRPADSEHPLLAAFPTIDDLGACLNEVASARDLPVWHVSFSNPEFVKRRQKALGKEPVPGESPLGLFVYFGADAATVEPRLVEVIARHRGQIVDQAEADHEWAERFYPMRLKRLGPSLIPSEALVPLSVLPQMAAEIAARVPGIAIEGTVASRKDVAILAFQIGDERRLNYNLAYAKSLMVADIAMAHGGRPYSLGAFFADEAERVLGKARLEKVRAFKAQEDPSELFNPGKAIANEGRIRTAMAAGRMGRPFLDAAGAVLGAPEEADPEGPEGNGAKKGNGEIKGIPARLVHEAYTCAQCGYCVNNCTLAENRNWESSSPRGKWYFLREYLKGNLPLTEEMVRTFLLCTTCRRCEAVCQVNIPIERLWGELRGVLVQEKGYPTFSAFEMMGAAYEQALNIWAGFKHERDAWMPPEISYQSEGEVGYWAGCTASYLETDIAANAARILHDGGITFAYLGKDESCCGVPFFMAGKWDLWEKAIRYNVEQVNKRGIKKLVVSCPGCWVTLEHHYREWAPKLGLQWNVDIEHITETASNLIKEGRLTFKQAVNRTVAWHDPCHIGRHGGIYQPPRDVLNAIPGLTVVEMDHNRENGLCCGSVLTRIGDWDTSDRIAAARLGEAGAAGADAVVTTCPCCEFQLRVGGQSNGISTQVLDFANIVAQGLGYQTEDPSRLCWDRWGVFKQAIEQMSVPKMVEMMYELMPGMFQILPGMMQAGMGMMKAMPHAAQDGMFALMDKMVLWIMPALIKQMLPKMMPDMLKYMEEHIPNMPPSMKAQMPEMMPIMMDHLMPSLMPKIMPLVKPEMMRLMKEEVRRKKVG